MNPNRGFVRMTSPRTAATAAPKRRGVMRAPEPVAAWNWGGNDKVCAVYLVRSSTALMKIKVGAEAAG